MGSINFSKIWKLSKIIRFYDNIKAIMRTNYDKNSMKIAKTSQLYQRHLPISEDNQNLTKDYHNDIRWKKVYQLWHTIKKLMNNVQTLTQSMNIYQNRIYYTQYIAYDYSASLSIRHEINWILSTSKPMIPTTPSTSHLIILQCFWFI